MKRENRYLIFKRSDVEKYFHTTQKDLLIELANDMTDARTHAGKEPLKAVVIEHDWPEYEIVWQLIEARVDGMPNDKYPTKQHPSTHD